MALDMPELRSLSGALWHFFHYPSPLIIGAQALVAFALRLRLPEFSAGDLGIPLAIAIYWPLQEWFVHVRILHLRPRQWRGKPFDPMVARIHRFHHRHPWRLDTVFLPWYVPAALAPVQWWFWFAVTPTDALAYTGITAFSLAALLYEWNHYLTHTPYQPRGRYYKAVQRNHRNHHFRNERRWHSFTAPILDEWFGTGGDPAQVPRSETCMTLGVDEG